MSDDEYAAKYSKLLLASRENALLAKRWTGSSRWNSPSLLGNPCLRYLVLKRTKGNLARPVSVGLQARFDVGSLIGKATVRDMIDMGWEVGSIESVMEWPEHQISGRPDFAAKPPKSPREWPTLPLEVKSCAPYVFNGIHNYGDVHDAPSWRTRAWLTQLNLYLAMMNKPEGLLLIVSLNGAWQAIPAPLDMDIVGGATARADAVNRHLAGKTEPEPICDPEVCPMCDFFQTEACDITLAFAKDIGVITDGGTITDIKRYLDLKDPHAEYERLGKNLKVKLEGVERALVPDVCIVTGRQQTRHVNAQDERTDTFWQVKYLPVDVNAENGGNDGDQESATTGAESR